MLRCPDFIHRTLVQWKVLTKEHPERQGAGIDVLGILGHEYAQSPVYNQLLTITQHERTIAELQRELLSERSSVLLLQKKHERPVVVVPPAPVSKRELKVYRQTQAQEELARIEDWLRHSERPDRFTKDNLHDLQTLLRRRISRIQNHES